jgi:predicted permease
VAGRSSRWPRRLLVAGEVALGVVLLVSAGLLVRTFLHLRGLNPGFDPSNVVVGHVSLQDARYAAAVRVNQLFDQSLEQIRRQPGVEAAGVALGLPYTRLLNYGWSRVEGATPENRGGMTNVSYVTPGYMEALRMPLRRGRLFGASDRAASTQVAIVNEEFVRRFYKDADIIGQHIRFNGVEREVVGVVGTARATASGLGGDGAPLIMPFVLYIPASQTTDGFLKQVHVWFSPAWAVRSAAPVGSVVETMRQAIASVDPLLPIAKTEPMADVKAASIAQQRCMMALVVGLGVVALMLAAIGIHGLISSSVTERTRELGIRLALGASGRQVLGTVLAPGLALAVIGVIVGSAASLGVSRLMQSFIWGVQPTDPVTYAAVAAVLLLVSLGASVIPAWRVLRLDPALTLRAE